MSSEQIDNQLEGNNVDPQQEENAQEDQVNPSEEVKVEQNESPLQDNLDQGSQKNDSPKEGNEEQQNLDEDNPLDRDSVEAQEIDEDDEQVKKAKNPGDNQDENNKNSENAIDEANNAAQIGTEEEQENNSENVNRETTPKNEISRQAAKETQKAPEIQQNEEKSEKQDGPKNEKLEINQESSSNATKSEDPSRKQSSSQRPNQTNQQNEKPQLIVTPVKKEQEKQNRQTQKCGIDDFLNGTLDHYRTAEKAFRSIDKKKKGYLELSDLAAELLVRFNVSDEQIQKEIFSTIGGNTEKIQLETFVKAFEKKVEQRTAEKERQLATLNLPVNGSAESNHQSPFKDQHEREDIMNIFKKDQPISLEEVNKQEHFQPDNKYAPLIRKLRQQNNFDDFVKSYNSLSLLSPQQMQQQYQQQHLHSQQQQQNYEPFSSLFSSSNQGNLFSSQQNYMSTSPSRPQMKYQAQTFSPLKISFESQKDQISVPFSSSSKVGSLRQSYLDAFQQKQSSASRSNAGFFKNGTSSQRFQSTQDLFQSPKQATLNGFSGSDRGFAKLAQSSYLPAMEDQQSPNKRRLERLKKKVNIGIESLQNVHRSQEFVSPHNRPRVSSGQGNVRDQFKQFMGQVGFESQPKFEAFSSSKDDTKFNEFFSRLNGQGGRKKSTSSDSRRFSSPITELFVHSQSPSSHGVHGQMKRVQQIQASLRTLPKKKSASKPAKSQPKQNGGSGLAEWKFVPKFEAVSSPKDSFKTKKGQTGFFSKRTQQ